MSQGVIKITLICDANTEKDIENALINSGIQLTKEEVKEPIEAHVFYIPNLLPVISVALIGYIFAFLQKFLGILSE